MLHDKDRRTNLRLILVKFLNKNLSCYSAEITEKRGFFPSINCFIPA